MGQKMGIYQNFIRIAGFHQVFTRWDIFRKLAQKAIKLTYALDIQKSN